MRYVIKRLGVRLVLALERARRSVCRHRGPQIFEHSRLGYGYRCTRCWQWRPVPWEPEQKRRYGDRADV